jgi:hypothetical protein
MQTGKHGFIGMGGKINPDQQRLNYWFKCDLWQITFYFDVGIFTAQIKPHQRSGDEKVSCGSAGTGRSFPKRVCP